MMNIKIESGIPIPPRKWMGNGLSAALRKMKPGDSFLYPLNKRNVLTAAAKRCEMRIATRRVDEKTLRAWKL